MQNTNPKYVYPYLPHPPLSRLGSPWAIVRFSHGLNSPPEIYCFADTFEETEGIRKLLEKVLVKQRGD